MRIKLADERFDEREFLHGAKLAFGMIVEAYAKGDADALRPLLSQELYAGFAAAIETREKAGERSEEHTSELQSLMRISYAVFCLKTHKKSTDTKTICSSR